MSTSSKKKTPKIGEVYVARGDVDCLLPRMFPTVWDGSEEISIPTRQTIPKGTYVLLMDVQLRSAVFPGTKREAIIYKVLSMDRRQVLYVEVFTPGPGRPIDFFDYQAAAHSWYLSFNAMSPA